MTQPIDRFGQMDILESKLLRFNLSPDLEPGEAIQSTTLEVEDTAAVDPAPALFPQGDPIISGQQVLQLVVARMAGARYHFRVRAVGATTGLAHVCPGYVDVVRR